jgi:hypothetical protein
MTKEQQSNFDPVQEAIRLVHQDLSKIGWTKADWEMALRLSQDHASVLDKTKEGQALTRSIEKFGTVFEAKPQWGEGRLAQAEKQTQEREAQEAEARRYHLHLLAWTDPHGPKVTSLPRDHPDVPIKSIEISADLAGFCNQALAFYHTVAGKVILVVEGNKARLMAAASITELHREDPPPKRIFLLGIVARQKQVEPVKEFLLNKLEIPPEQLIGVIARKANADKFHSAILTALKEAFPLPDSGLRPQN